METTPHSPKQTPIEKFNFKGKSLLVTGGAGYIGSHVVRQLGETGATITVYDNLSTGQKKAVLCGELIEGDLGDTDQLKTIFKTRSFDAALHFAGSIIVPESVKKPLDYYENNTQNSLSLLRLCNTFNVPHFIFSSTAAVYGIPSDGTAKESSPLQPINPYGRSKLMTEWMLQDLSQVTDLSHVILRYFNVAGADFQARIGQATPNATHLIKVACQAACGTRDEMAIFGTDYDTPDGTCIRDYIHVEDLAYAHILALKYLFEGGTSQVVNCGYNQGYSVKAVIDTVQRLTKTSFPIKMLGRRDGDPPVLIAQSDQIRSVLGWEPQYNDLDKIVMSAYEFEKTL